MLLFNLITLFWQIPGLAAQAFPLDAHGISLDEKVLAIERLLLTPGTIIFPVDPCNEILNGPPGNGPEGPDQIGDQTSAQWVRTVFHDFITANVTAQTGGLDASISFETDRPENLGLVFNVDPALGDADISFINTTIIAFNLFANVFVSTSDFIALGLACALLTCDPNDRMIQLKAGRVDAIGPGPLGVPQSNDSLVTAKAAFANAGFNQKDMIQAVACGHSLGAVHNRNFPQIVGKESAIGSHGAAHFDSTPDKFDHVNIAEYLNGSGQAGGPLVTTENIDFRSDFRIFNSDGNATITAMNTPQTFEDTCFDIFERMINTVPKGVTLSTNSVGPRPWITIETHLDLDSTGAVLYSGTIATHSRNGSPESASYHYGTFEGENIGPKLTNTGFVPQDTFNNITSTPFGTVTWYNFTDTMNSSSIATINVENSYIEAINLNLFVLPSQSFVNNTNFNTPQYLVRAALLTSLSSKGTTLIGTLYFPAGQPNSVAPLYTQASATLTQFKTQGAYTIFQGVINQPAVIPANNTATSHIDVQLGPGLRSAKVMVSPLETLGSFFGVCTQNPLTSCTIH